MSEFQFLSVEAYEEYNDGFECCVGCMEKNVSFVNLKTCKHAGVLSLLCKDLIQILDSTSEIVPLCFICHALLKKAYNFKLQVEESYHILHSKTLISSEKHNKTHHSKLEKRTAADIYLSIKKEDDSLLEDYEVEVKVEPKEESRDDLASVEGHSEVEGSDSYDVEPTQSTTEEPKPKSKCREAEYKGMLNFITLNEEEMLRERDLERQSVSYQNLPYKCEKCIVGFDHSVSLERHNNIRHDTKLGNHKCHICESVLRSEATFKDHVTRHYLRIECAKCQKRTNNLRTARAHYNEAHEVTQTVFRCDQCDYQDVSYRKYRYHREKHKGKKKCDLCDRTFVNDYVLRDHLISHHGQSKDKDAFTCKYCKKTYKHRSPYKAHMKTCSQQPNKPEPEEAFCAPCQKTFKSTIILKRHLQTHSAHNPDAKKFQCESCDRRFISRASLKEHVDFAHLNIAHDCQVCGKSFASEKALTRHIQFVHEKKRPPKNKICDYCGKGFTSSAMLSCHVRTHTGARPLPCTRCGACFAHPAALYRHTRAH